MNGIHNSNGIFLIVVKVTEQQYMADGDVAYFEISDRVREHIYYSGKNSVH